MGVVRDLELAARAFAHEDASVIDAAQTLVDERVSGIAIVDSARAVVGVLTAFGVIRALFPPHLGDLRHTGFVPDALDALARRTDEAAGEYVRDHMTSAETVGPDDGTLHAAERFLHSTTGVLVVVDGGRFAGVLDRVGFARALLEQALGADGATSR